jgi:hypothetical protein
MASRLCGESDSWPETEADTKLAAVAGVLNDRRPSWLTDFVNGNLKAEFYTGLGPWPLARKLVSPARSTGPRCPNTRR